ncbi:MAG TPA: hypothetical protein VN462_08890, partial [Negativicutes bacterium]|nr:hypothetical protein [Negativicutes bacterium]
MKSRENKRQTVGLACLLRVSPFLVQVYPARIQMGLKPHLNQVSIYANLQKIAELIAQKGEYYDLLKNQLELGAS